MVGLGRSPTATKTTVGLHSHSRERWDRSTKWILGLSAGVTVVPVVVDLALSGTRRLYAYTAADAFYYLVVARNWARHGVPSFDGAHVTNGFHPLWQADEAGISVVANALGIGGPGTLWLVVGLQLLLLGAAVVVLGSLLAAVHGRLTRWFVLVAFGWYGVVFAPLWIWAKALGPAGVNPVEGPMPMYGTLWSDVNGMESALSVMVFVLVLWLHVHRPVRTRQQAVVFGVALGCLVLSRLDLAFIAMAFPMVGWAASPGRRRGVERRGALHSAAVLGAIIGAYLLFNRLYAGAAFPTSGSEKSTFPRPTLGNWRDVSSLLDGNTTFASVRAYRHGPILIAAAVALLFLATTGRAALREARSGQGDMEPLVRYRLGLVATAIGALALSAYDWFFVPAYAEGHWYWAVSCLFVTLVGFEWVYELASWQAIGPSQSARRSAWMLATGTVALVVGCLVAFSVLGRRRDYHERFASFAESAAPSARVFASRHHGVSRGIVSVDDGIDAWALDVPSLSGTGLMLDVPAARASNDGRLLVLAYHRGFRWLSSVAYVDTRGLSYTTSSAELRRRIAGMLPGQDLERFRFRVVYLSRPLPWPDGAPRPYALIRFDPVSN